MSICDFCGFFLWFVVVVPETLFLLKLLQPEVVADIANQSWS